MASGKMKNKFKLKKADQTQKPGGLQNNMTPEEYNAYVKEVTPVHSTAKNVFHAFIVGGLICTLGQVIKNWLSAGMHLGNDEAGTWTSVILIGLSVICTGFNLYSKITKWGGTGALVPITGFANSVASSAIEAKAEGQVFGIGCKIFNIAGPVILYGIFSSWVLGFIYWVLK